MQLMQYLLCVATQHARARDEHKDELNDIRLSRKRVRQRHDTLTHRDEVALLKHVVGSVPGKPTCLKRVTLPAITILSYVVKAKMAVDPFIEGHEIIDKLVCDPEQTVMYLHGFAELKARGWLRFIETPGLAFTDQPPYCWLQASIELGDTFHREMGEGNEAFRSFSSNDAYLDAVYSYLNAMIQDDSGRYHINDPETELSTFQPEGWFRRIAQREGASTCSLPAAEAREKYSLSVLQHLVLVGLLGMRDGDVRYDFASPAEAANLFAAGRVCRKGMMKHLFGPHSQLMTQRLVCGAKGTFGEMVQLTSQGMTALLGRTKGRITGDELRHRVKKSSLFDIEEPNVGKGALLLPETVINPINTIIFCESRKGRQIRQRWHESLPTAWGSPTGTTALLYGPPGTGKTLTAQYIASELKLPLLKIDASQVLSCWVGESEQNVRRIFDDYTMLQNELGISPVLLLNEADQLLAVRGSSGNAVERMNNNMQNLFLEGLERFTGILIATTNRRDLLDEAFSRRFTYKVGLPPPDCELRAELWRRHLPMSRLADDVNIEHLADLELTGGEIRLVVERAVRLQAFRGLPTIDGATLLECAREELAARMTRDGSMNRIGFVAGRSLSLRGLHELYTR